MEMAMLTSLGFAPGPKPYGAWANLDLNRDETSHLRHRISSFYNPSVRCVTYAAWVNPPAKSDTFALLAGGQSGQSY